LEKFEAILRLIIYNIKELVLKLSSKFYACGDNIAKLKGITGLPKTWGQERELKIKILGGGGASVHVHGTGRPN
jgi:hypothetical protein